MPARCKSSHHHRHDWPEWWSGCRHSRRWPWFWPSWGWGRRGQAEQPLQSGPFCWSAAGPCTCNTVRVMPSVHFTSRWYLCTQKSPYLLPPSLTSLPNTACEMVPMFVWTSHPHSVKVHKSVCQSQFSSRWHLCMQKSPYVLHHIFKKIAWSCLWKSSSVHLTDNGPFLSFQGRSFGWVLLYVHKNCRLMRDESLGQPPQLSHSPWALKEDHWVLSSFCASLLQVIHSVVSWLYACSLCVSTSLTFQICQDARHLRWFFALKSICSIIWHQHVQDSSSTKPLYPSVCQSPNHPIKDTKSVPESKFPNWTLSQPSNPICECHCDLGTHSVPKHQV